jgi:hypothetical protein
MALQVTGNIELDNGISINSLYCRINPSLDIFGTRIFCQPLFFISKEKFQNNSIPFEKTFNLNLFLDYDMATEGRDILLLSNEWIKFQLESKGYAVSITDL